MLLTLIRHGEACAPTAALGDRGRALTIRGREESQETGRALASRGLVPSQIWTSPLVRAVQTAELVAAALPYDRVIEARGDLYPSSDVEELCAALRRHAAERKEYEIAVRTFEQDRDTESLTETLAALGYDADEIAAHVTTPGYRFPERFI